MPDVPTESPQPRPRRTILAIAALAAGFAAVMMVREPIQARYFAWQISRDDQRPEFYEHYYFKLACLKDAALPAVRMLLDDDDPEHRHLAARLLHHVSPDTARPILGRCLTDTDADVRRTAAMGLALDTDPAVADTFRGLIGNTDENVSSLAAGMLGRMGGDAAADALLEVLAGDPRPMLKAEAIDGLGRIRDPRAVAAITAALVDHRPLPHSTEWDRLAAEALVAARAQLADELAASQPVGTLLTAPTTVSEVAARALRRIGGDSAGAAMDRP